MQVQQPHDDTSTIPADGYCLGPQPSEHGAQAALLAHKAAARSVESGKPSSTDHGYTAATSAFNADRTSRRSNPHAAVPLDRQRSLVAAKGAMATPTATRRSRANTLPNRKQHESYPDESNAASNALKAATAAHKPKASAPSKDAGATPFVQMNRQMFTSKPPVQAESDEQRREDALHASALTMAKKMFEQQQKVIDQTKKAQQNNTAPHTRRRRSSVSDDDEAPPMQFNSLQDAAYKAAQERLAKLDIEMQSRNYKDYYGQGQPQRKSSSVRGKLRRRSSSDGDIRNDRERSQQIRQQMSIFNNKVSQVDQQKRQHDRDALLAAAQRNVTARLKGMDDKIARETGMMPPSTKASWDSKAHATAQLRSDNRVSHQHGKIDIGAGKYMEQEEIDAIAASKVQPVIDEINERAEQEHARVTEQKLEEERQREERELERQREQEVSDINRKLKEQEKQEAKERRQEEKAEAKAKKEEEKATKAEQKRLAKEEKRKSAAVSETAPASVAQQDEIAPIERVALNDAGQPVRVPTHPLAPAAITPESPTEATTTRAADDVEMPDASAIRKHRTKSSGSGGKSPTIRVRSWFQSHFHRGSKSDVEGENGGAKPKDKGKTKFIGGAALTGFGSSSQNGSTASVNNRSSSVHAVAMAGRPQTEGAGAHHMPSSNASERGGGGHSPLTPSVSLHNPEAVSPISSSSEDEFFHDVAPVISSTSASGGGLSPPRPLGDPASRKSHSPNRDSRFHEII
ncbi:hypothetical protein PG999_011919 [Apiospora kogelbergensis]|uniref:Eisosome protein 1 n=1 Tax=Apiospora kogelbergensis TaxID=1337665 RepID=A0AAW0QEF3_9PEZI